MANLTLSMHSLVSVFSEVEKKNRVEDHTSHSSAGFFPRVFRGRDELLNKAMSPDSIHPAALRELLNVLSAHSLIC